MAWIRLSDDYNDHPKFDNLSDGAFRLWHQAMGFCRKFHTDGQIPTATVRKFKAFSAKRQAELMTPWQPAAEPLWHAVDGFGVRVHDYVEWNLSKEEEQAERDGSRSRMKAFRERRRSYGVTPPVTSAVTNGDVPGRVGKGSDVLLSEKGSGEKLLPLSARSKRPIFRGQRFVVFEWQLDDLTKMLGNYTDGFDLHTWFFDLDEQARRTDMVIPPRDGGQWLLNETLAEARRRGLAVAETAPSSKQTLSQRMLAMVQKSRSEAS